MRRLYSKARAQTSPPRSVVYCIDPEQWGYTRTRRTAYVPAEVLAAREAHAAALEVAAEVRMQFLTATYASAKAAKTLQLDALRAVVTDPRCLEVPEAFHPDIQRLAGCGLEQAATARADRLARLLVARWLCSAEANLRQVAAGRGWGVDAGRAEEYLGRLTDAGYVLSEAEQHVREENREFLAARAHDLNDTEATETGDTDHGDDSDGDAGGVHEEASDTEAETDQDDQEHPVKDPEMTVGEAERSGEEGVRPDAPDPDEVGDPAAAPVLVGGAAGL